jgi:hypothetical protein
MNRKKFDVGYLKMPPPSAGLLETLASLAEGYGEVIAARSQFIAFFCCLKCGEPVSVLGQAKSMKKMDRSFPQLSIACFSPSLQIFDLKHVYPARVRTELAKSFAAFFGDSTAAGSRVRTCIEFLLDEQGIQKFRTNKEGQVVIGKDGGQMKLSLGERLKEFSESSPDLGNMLGAVKQLGNEATHGPDLLNEDLLDAYGLIEHVLEELYVTRPERTRLLTQSNEMTQKFR